jgi:predicted DNA-binding transcriptional regulator YafY
MSRAQRLLDLIDILRRHRFPVAGSVLARELGVSLRTLYRDIATLQQQGADIEGEPGLGYVLRPGFLLPPLMFSEDELEALVLGVRWVAGHGDRRLAVAATSALARVSAVLPDALRGALESNGLMVASRRTPDADDEMRDEQLAHIRTAIRRSRKLDLGYHDVKGAPSQRRVWPIALGYFEQARVLVAWCELRDDFRHFRCDRIATLGLLDVGYPRGRQALLREWRLRQDARVTADEQRPCVSAA